MLLIPANWGWGVLRELFHERLFEQCIRHLQSIPIIGLSKMVLVVKKLPDNVGDTRDAGWIPGSGRSLGVGNGKPL